MSVFSEYGNHDGLGLAELVKSKQVKPGELIEEAISRIEKLNPHLNAVIYKMYDQAIRYAKGDLPDGHFKGVPFLLKDLLMCYAGIPLRNGSWFFKDYVPDHDSELIKHFRAAGVIILGKTNLPEFGLAPVTEPELFGPSYNPWDLKRNPGGSSGGSAAAVAARMVPLAHASDGGGSIRIPSSCCGVFGLKPTRGRTPVGPDYSEIWRGFHVEHVITRSVRDSAAMLDATTALDTIALNCLSKPDTTFLSQVGKDPGKLHIAFVKDSYLGTTIDEDCLSGFEMTVKLCHELGHDVEEAKIPVDGKTLARAFLTVICGEVMAFIEDSKEIVGKNVSYRYFEPVTWVTALLGRQFKASEYTGALNLIQRTGRQINKFFTNYDVLLTPTLTRLPLMTGTLQLRGIQAIALKLLGFLNAGGVIKMFVNIDELAERFFSFIQYLPIFNVTGQPAMSVPLYWNDEGLPIGMQFVGRYGDEATLFRLAGQLEKAKPWADRMPPVCFDV